MFMQKNSLFKAILLMPFQRDILWSDVSMRALLKPREQRIPNERTSDK